MNEFEGRMQTILNSALDAAFSHVRHGGDHESRKLIAARLMDAARAGTTAVDELTSIARRALLDLGNRSRTGGEAARASGGISESRMTGDPGRN